MVVTNFGEEKVWVEKASYDKAECLYFEKLAKECRVPTHSDVAASGSLANEVAKARQHIKKGLQYLNNINEDAHSQDLAARVSEVERENSELKVYTQQLNTSINELKQLVEQLRKTVLSSPPKSEKAAPAKSEASATQKDEEEDDDVDLFGSDSEEENEEAAKIREERLAAYAAKKSKKPALIAKSNIILDVKPWDDETDMKAMEEAVRKITCDGLLWGAAKLVPLAYGIRKLQISCVIEDDKVSVDWLTEEIEKIEDLVQSIDIAAFNKV